MKVTHFLASLGRLGILLLPFLAAGQSFQFSDLEVVSSRRVGRTEFEYVLRVAVTNRVASASGVRALAFSTSTNTFLVDNAVEFGDLNLGDSATSTDTFTVRHNREVPFDPSVLQWFPSARSMPLSVLVDAPISGVLTNGTNVLVRGSVGPAVEAVLVGRFPSTLTGTNFTAEVPLEEGRNTISVLATNTFGGAGVVNVMVNRDTTPPLLNIESPADGAILATRQVAVSGLVNDAVPGTVNPDQATVLVNGLEATVLNRSYAIADVLLTPGRNTIDVVAIDRAGNTSQRQVEILVQDLASQKRLVRLAGDNQTGVIGTVLPSPLVVELLDGNGSAQTNQPVTFAVTRNDGVLVTAAEVGRSITLFTDENGQAAIDFQLGTRTGVANNQVSVTSPGVAGELMFASTAIGSAPTQVTPLIPEKQVGEVGKELPLPWTVLVTDAGGNPVADAPVTFLVVQGDGRLGSDTTAERTTDSDGRATVRQTLGPAPGINNNLLLATVAGLTNSAAIFTASGLEPQQVQDTRLTGLVLDHVNRPMSNILCIIHRTSLAAVTDQQGQFVISNAPVGAVRLLVDARDRGYPGAWHALEFDIVTVAGRDNSFDRPIYMLPLDDENSVLAGGAQDVTLELEGLPGSTMTIFAHSVRDSNNNPITNRVSWTQVNNERVPMTPPLGSQPLLTTTVQPAGLRFNPPARMCVPNPGLPQGQIVEMYGFDHDLAAFVAVGTATVSPDGSQICSDPGFGVTKSGWFPFVPPPPPCPSPRPPCSGPPADGECFTWRTIPPAGECDCPTYAKVPRTNSCNDNDVCTENDRCQGTECKGDKIELDPSVQISLGGIKPAQPVVDEINEELKELKKLGIIASVNLLQVTISGSEKGCCHPQRGEGKESKLSAGGSFGGFSVKGKLWPPGPIPKFGPYSLDVWGLVTLKAEFEMYGGLFIGVSGNISGEIGKRQSDCEEDPANAAGCFYAELATAMTGSLSAEASIGGEFSCDGVFCPVDKIAISGGVVLGNLSMTLNISKVSYNGSSCSSGLTGGVFEFDPLSFKVSANFSGSYEADGSSRSVDATVEFLSCEISLSKGVECSVFESPF